jgi:hypothetical protein
MSRLSIAGALAVGAVWFAVHAGAFSYKPVYIDPALGGWVAPLRTVCFQAGCGKLFYVVGIHLGERRDLNVVCQSKVTLRRFDRRQLGRFAQELARTIAAAVEDLAKRNQVDGVVLTFYCTFLKDDVQTLEIYESCLPAQAFGALGPIPMRTVERRVEHLPPP